LARLGALVKELGKLKLICPMHLTVSMPIGPPNPQKYKNPIFFFFSVSLIFVSLFYLILLFVVTTVIF